MSSTQVIYTLWDARKAFPDGYNFPDGEIKKVALAPTDALTDMVRNGGSAVVLPGPEPHMAVLITVYDA